MQNDDALSTFILRHVFTSDIDRTAACTSAYDLFVCLCALHEHQGAYASNHFFFVKVLGLRLSYDAPLQQDTLAEVCDYHLRITAMGQNQKDDDILVVYLLRTM